MDEEYDEAAVQQSIDNSMPPGTAYVELLQMVKQDELQGTKSYSSLYSWKSVFLQIKLNGIDPTVPFFASSQSPIPP